MDSTISQYREFPLVFMAYSESGSFMSKINSNNSSGASNNGPSSFYSPLMTYIDSLSQGNYGNRSIWYPQLVNLMSSGQGAGPSFWSTNGYVLANTPTFEMCRDDKVIWYVLAYGSMSHVFHMHGNSFDYNGDSMPAISKFDSWDQRLHYF